MLWGCSAAAVAGGKEGEYPREEVIGSPSVVRVDSLGNSQDLCVPVHLRENC